MVCYSVVVCCSVVVCYSVTRHCRSFGSAVPYRGSPLRLAIAAAFVDRCGSSSLCSTVLRCSGACRRAPLRFACRAPLRFASCAPLRFACRASVCFACHAPLCFACHASLRFACHAPLCFACHASLCFVDLGSICAPPRCWLGRHLRCRVKRYFSAIPCASRALFRAPFARYFEGYI